MGLDEIRRNPLTSSAAIGTGAIAGGVGTAAVVLGRKHGGKFAATPAILRTAALPLALGAVAGGVGMGMLAMRDPKAARNTTVTVGGSTLLGAGAGALGGARLWKQSTEVQRQGMPMWRFAGSHAVSGIAQHALPLVAGNVILAGVVLATGAKKSDD